jgi:hypothetical protein
MALRQRSASHVASPLNGAKNGSVTGKALNIAALNVEAVNEADHLYSL